MRPEDFQAQTGINDEALERFKIYHALLLKWQKAINLVSPKTIDDAWTRHFYDSAQLVNFIPDSIKTLADLGSGAGFPGLVIALLRPDINIHLIESDQRKCEFLKTVSRETGTSCSVHASRIEDIASDISPDIVTARALASLSDLLGYCTPWIMSNENLELLFLKGAQAEDEIEQARTAYAFDVGSSPSATENNARIICLRSVSVLDVQT